MKLRCCRKREYRALCIYEFAVIKAEQKYIIGVMPDGDEWFLPHKSSVMGIELSFPEFMRASRSVLVAPQHILGVSGNSKTRILHTTAGDYRLSRLMNHEPFKAAAQKNASSH